MLRQSASEDAHPVTTYCRGVTPCTCTSAPIRKNSNTRHLSLFCNSSLSHHYLMQPPVTGIVDTSIVLTSLLPNPCNTLSMTLATLDGFVRSNFTSVSIVRLLRFHHTPPPPIEQARLGSGRRTVVCITAWTDTWDCDKYSGPTPKASARKMCLIHRERNSER